MIAGILIGEIKRLLAYPYVFILREILPLIVWFTLPNFLWQVAAPEKTELGWYFVFAFVAYQLFTPEGAYISREVYDGTVTRYILYPRNLARIFFTRFLGYAALQLFICFLFLMLGFLVIASPVSGEGILKFLILMPFGVVVGFLCFSLAETVTLWLEDGWTLRIMLEFVVFLLAGRLIRVDYLPEVMEFVSQVFPFKFLAYVPSVAILNELSWGEVCFLCLQAFGWIVFLGVLFSRVVKNGLARFSAFGL